MKNNSPGVDLGFIIRPLETETILRRNRKPPTAGLRSTQSHSRGGSGSIERKRRQEKACWKSGRSKRIQPPGWW